MAKYNDSNPDPYRGPPASTEDTRPNQRRAFVDPWEATRPQRSAPHAPSKRVPQVRRKRRGCLLSTALPLGILLGLILGILFLAPFRTNLLLLGIDRAPEGTRVGRSDTMILTTFVPLEPYVGMLSIPRDLWVPIPGGDVNRINTAHFFAEAQQEGAGPQAAKEVVEQNFGVEVHYYLRIEFAGLQRFVDAMGGVSVDLPAPMSGYEAGEHHLNGEQALAFVRDRAGSDDFARMLRGQIFVRGVLRSALRPVNWPRLPVAIPVLMTAIDSDLPIWMWPRLGLAMLRAGEGGIDGRTITREMVNPFTTNGGANVLAPNWAAINPVLFEMFGQ